MPNKVGRPLKYKTVEELQKVIDEYFDTCDTRIKTIYTKEGDDLAINIPAPYTMTGLANALGLSRQALLDYSERDQFLDTIKRARGKVEEYAENQLYEGKSPAGVIFNLKNNFGWKDKTEVENTIKLPTPILGGISDVSIDDGATEALEAPEED